MLPLFVCTFEGLLRLGDRFRVEQLRQICAASLKGHVSQADLDKILEPSIVKQNPLGRARERGYAQEFGT
jgi:hypothetical protein